MTEARTVPPQKTTTCFSGFHLRRPPLASGKDCFPTLAASMGSKLWLGNQEAFSGDYWIVEETE